MRSNESENRRLALGGVGCGWKAAGLTVGLAVLAGCDRGCDPRAPGARSLSLDWLGASRLPLLNAVDCPDGLARCDEGAVRVSRLATRPVPCEGPPERCACPWDRLPDCPWGCAAEGVEVVMNPDQAAIQLCAPPPTARKPFVLTEPPHPAAASCGEGERYRCGGGRVVDCEVATVGARCIRG